MSHHFTAACSILMDTYREDLLTCLEIYSEIVSTYYFVALGMNMVHWFLMWIHGCTHTKEIVTHFFEMLHFLLYYISLYMKHKTYLRNK